MNASGNQRSVQSEIARPRRTAPGSRCRSTAGVSTIRPGSLHPLAYCQAVAERDSLRHSLVASEAIQGTEGVLVGARDARAPPGHVPEVLQAGGVATRAEPQQRRAGVGQLTREGRTRLPGEARVVRLIYPVVGPDAPVRGEVVARLGPRAPATNLRLKLVDHAEL